LTEVSGPVRSSLRLQELLGREVVDQAGRSLGRVVDCLAQPRDDRLRVVGLLVGRSAWRARFGPQPRPLGRLVPWQDILALEPKVIARASARAT
jgi:sporulation protein YlmC with PRC-barrel domain